MTRRIDIAAERITAARQAREERASPDDAKSAPADPSGQRHSPHDLRAYAITAAKRWDAAPVQMKLIKAGKALEAVDDESAISRELRESEQEFTLRDDSVQTDKAVHVLERKVYLLGEMHNASDWAERTAHWSVATMHEKKKDAGAVGKSGAVNADKEEAKARPAFPLESIYAYAAQEIVTLRFQANAMRRFSGDVFDKYKRVRANRRSTAEDWLQVVKSLQFIGPTAEKMLGGLRALRAINKQIGEYIETIKHSDELRDVARVISLESLVANNDFVKEAVGFARKLAEKQLPTVDKVMRQEEQWAVLLRSLHNEMTILDLPHLATDFADAAEATDGQKEGVAAMMGEDRPTNAEARSGASGLRETAMAARIHSGPRPLLVQLGDDHVAPLAATLGIDAVAVPIEKVFEDLTKRPAPG